MNFKNKKSMLLAAVFSALPYTTHAQYLSTNDIYRYAQNRDYWALSRIAQYIDMQDSSGNTALCLAAANKDTQAYNVLIQYGANPRPYCLQSAPVAKSNSGTFLGMGKAGWLTTGAVVAVGAGVAVAAGGGGGGGSSSSSSSGNSGGSSGSGNSGSGSSGSGSSGSGSGGGNSGSGSGGSGSGGGNSGSGSSGGNSGGNSGSGSSGSEDSSATKYLDNEQITDKDNGQEIVGKTIAENNPDSETDYLNNSNNGTIKKVVSSQSAVSGIASESVSTFNALSFDGNKTANIIVAQRGSGDVYGIKGPQVNNSTNNADDDDDDDGINVHNAVFADFDEKVATGNVTGNITIRNTGAGTGNIYGIQVDTLDADEDSYAVNALIESESTAASATGNILIENINSDKNIYGIYSSGEAANAESDEKAKAFGYITINNGCDGDVYGIKAVKEAYNSDATESSASTSRIDITSKGNGDVYGINNEGYLYNAAAGHDRWEDEEDAATAKATINIDNTGTGDVYGLKSLSDIYNAYSYYDSNALGTVRISNNGSGDAYGIFGNNSIENASAHSYNSNYHATAKGYINIINKSSGRTYGLYSDRKYNRIINNSESDGETQESVIEIANIADGLAVGIYSKNGTVENSGDIKIHNLADGIAIGIYADGTTNVTNSGTITIDRETYKDDMSTDDKSDDVTYTADSNKVGKAIGIYGAADSHITNTGTIKISGAATAYGIYSEGDESSVTNTGTILIDGQDNENAVKLNGGKLFQDGLIYAQGAWYNPCQGVTCGANATCSAVNGSGVCSCNSGYEGNANTGCTLAITCVHGTKNGTTCVCDKGWSGSDCSVEESSEPITDVDNGNPIIGKTIANSNLTRITDDDDVAYMGSNNSNIKKVVDSESSVIGLNIEAKFSSLGDIDGMSIDNAYSESGKKTVEIDITQKGKGNVYGILNPSSNKNTCNDNDCDSYIINAHSQDNGTTDATIKISNTGNSDGNIYGIQSLAEFVKVNNARVSSNAGTSSGLINISNTSDKNVYGIYSKYEVSNARAHDGNGKAVGTIYIQNAGDGDVYGIDGDVNYSHNSRFHDEVYNANVEDASTAEALIRINNTGDGDVFGINFNGREVFNAIADQNASAYGKIVISNQGDGDVYGIKSTGNIVNADQYDNMSTDNYHNEGTISIVNQGEGNAYGIHGKYVRNITDGTRVRSVIELTNVSNGLAVGIYSKDGTVENSGDINIHNLADGDAVGIYADGSTNVINSGTITIDQGTFVDDMSTDDNSDDVTYTADPSKVGKAIGIYGAADSHITNTGTIKISGAETAYGIYSEGDESSVTNYGTITIDKTSCNGTNCTSDNNAIVLNGGQLFQNGIMTKVASAAPKSLNMSSSGTDTAAAEEQLTSLNLNDFGGTVVASDTSQFVVEGAISGDLAINNSVIENGFDTAYSVKDMIKASDTSGLNLLSQSALFSSVLENNTDAVMTMKSFGSVVENNSIADFLQNNYAANNNEDLFKVLKSAENVAELNSSIDDLFGKDMLSRMAFEDLSMLREVNMDMNSHLFEKEGSFAFGENISPSSYDNKVGSVGRYSLNGYSNGKISLGIGVSITDVRTNDSNNDNTRFDRNFMMSAPIGYKTHGFELITAPKIGYVDGSYDRKGFNNKTYEGKIQKRMFALMNEARYPLNFGVLKLIPTAEFNMIGYNIKGHEDDQQYALRIQSQNHYSVETGFGLMAQKQFKPYKNHEFNINGGVMVYHEFANPYELKIGMRDMDGYYRLQDEKRSDNRAVVRLGFDYMLKDNLDFSANWLTNIDREYRNDANIKLKYNF